MGFEIPDFKMSSIAETTPPQPIALSCAVCDAVFLAELNQNAQRLHASQIQTTLPS
jgi:hypothetical protein